MDRVALVGLIFPAEPTCETGRRNRKASRSMPKVLELRPRPGPKPGHRLDADKIIESAKNLADDINTRLPGTNLAVLAEELARLAVATEERALRARRPFLAIRACSALAIGLVLLALWYLARHIHARWEFGTINNVFDAVNTGFNLLVLLAGALWFFVTFEAQLKRKEALGFIEELREFAHVIDVTQLYYTPDLYRPRNDARPANPAIDETYLLYCTQMLGVISNLAPLYTRGATGDSILRAASEVQMLAMAIISKHLAKAEAARGMQGVSSATRSQSDPRGPALAPA
jgi:hypothetical protein